MATTNRTHQEPGPSARLFHVLRLNAALLRGRILYHAEAQTRRALLAKLREHLGDEFWEGERQRIAKAWFGYRELSRVDEKRNGLITIKVLGDTKPEETILVPPSLFKRFACDSLSVKNESHDLALNTETDELPEGPLRFAQICRTGATSLEIDLQKTARELAPRLLLDYLKKFPAQIDWFP